MSPEHVKDFWMKRAQAAITMTPIIISPFVNFRWIGESMNWFLWWTFLTVFLCLFCVILKISFSFFFLRDCVISICEHSPVFKIKVLESGYSTCVTVEKKIFKLFQFHIRWYYTVHYIKYLSWSTVFFITLLLLMMHLCNRYPMKDSNERLYQILFTFCRYLS